MPSAYRILPGLAAVLLLFVAQTATATGGLPGIDADVLAPQPAPPAVGDAVTLQSNGTSLGQAIERVRRKYPGGRIISADTRRSGNREVHIIKVLTRDNTVKTERIAGRRLNNGG